MQRMTCQNCLTLQNHAEKLIAENTRLLEENTKLKHHLAAYENPHTPPSRRTYPTRSHVKRGSKRFPGRPRGHRGSTRSRPKPDVVKVPEWKDKCKGCGAPLGEPSSVDHRIVEEIGNPAPKQVIDFMEFEWECGACGSSIVSRHPDCPPRGRFGRNVLVQATLMKYEERLPHRKVCETLDRTYGLSITPATAFDVTRRVSE